jgi:hypothetical protein
MRIGPAPSDQSAMPEQQRLAPHREGVPGTARQHPAERSTQQPVLGLEPWSADLAAKDRKLVAERENLQLLGSVAAADEHDQLEQAQDNDLEG